MEASGVPTGIRVLLKRRRRSNSTNCSYRLRRKALFSLLVAVVVYQALVDLLSLCMYLQGRGGASGLSSDPFPVVSVTRRLASGSQREASLLRMRCQRLGGGVVSSTAPDVPLVPSSGGSGERLETSVTIPTAGGPEVDVNPEEGSPVVDPPPRYEAVCLTGGGAAWYRTVVQSGRESESPPPAYTLVDIAPPPYASGPPPNYSDIFSGTEIPETPPWHNNERPQFLLDENLYRRTVARVFSCMLRTVVCCFVPITVIIISLAVYTLFTLISGGSPLNAFTLNATSPSVSASISP